MDNTKLRREGPDTDLLGSRVGHLSLGTGVTRRRDELERMHECVLTSLHINICVGARMVEETEPEGWGLVGGRLWRPEVGGWALGPQPPSREGEPGLTIVAIAAASRTGLRGNGGSQVQAGIVILRAFV